jgi:hypothetical protein
MASAMHEVPGLSTLGQLLDTILNPLSCQPEGYAAAKEKEFWPTQAAWQLLPNPQTNAGISTQQMQNNAEKNPHKPSVSHTKHAR